MSASTLDDRFVDVVVGAGITGLTSAVEIERQGRGAALLESSGQTGGLCRSFIMDGVIFDIGPHMLMTRLRERSGIYLADLLRSERMYRRRYRFAVIDGRRIWRFPLTSVELMRYPSRVKWDILKSLLRKAGGNPADPSVEHCITRRTGTRHYAAVFEPIIRKKLGIRGSELHADWLQREAKNIYSREDKSFPAPSTAKRTPAAAAGDLLHEMRPMYRYPEKGICTVTDRLRDRFHGRLVTGCGDLRIIASGRKITGVHVQGSVLRAASLVWTAPVADFYRSLGETCPSPADSVTTRMVFITFRTSSRRRRPYLYSYHADPSTVFHRVSYPRSIFRDDSPSDVEGFCFEIRLSERIGALPEGSLVDLTVSDALREGVVSGSVLSATVVDVRHASPLLPPGYRKAEQTLFSALDRFDNLVFAGRQGNHCNSMLPDSLEQGILAAERVGCIHAAP